MEKSNAKIASGAANGLDQAISNAGKKAKGAGAHGLPSSVHLQLVSTSFPFQKVRAHRELLQP